MYQPRNLKALIAGAASAILVVVVAVALLFRGPPPQQRPVAKRSPTPAPSARHKARGPLTSPFTGERIRYLRRVLIFKIDNVPQARPPTGLASADIVYLLPVEGGLSRIFAVFSSHVPAVVGPVRSARQEDIQLLRQFGRPAFAYSGAKPDLLRVVQHARTVDLYAGTHYAAYFRGWTRPEPYNLYASARNLYAQARRRHASLAHDIGFRFGSAPPGGRPARSWFVRYPAASFGFRWSRHQGRWLVWMDGSPAVGVAGRQLGGPTVVVQYVRVTKSVFRERGVYCAYAHTVGSGSAVILRNGRAYRVHWSRPAANAGTTFTLPDGKRMLFARGQVWVVEAIGPHSTIG
jgi:hypothetical protein